MKRLLTILCLPALLLLSSTEGWSLPPCGGGNYLNWTNCFGTATAPDGGKYVGGWKDGKPHGQGTLTFGSGSERAGTKYDGEWKDGYKHGQGTETHANGDKYVGEFKDGKMHGQGTYTYADGRVWIGLWSDNNWASGSKYAAGETPSSGRPPVVAKAPEPSPPPCGA